jgi:hypothetical protein
MTNVYQIISRNKICAVTTVQGLFGLYLRREAILIMDSEGAPHKGVLSKVEHEDGSGCSFIGQLVGENDSHYLGLFNK